MAEEPRFDWPAIFRVTGIIVGGAAAFGLIVPLAVTPIFQLYNTGIVAGNEIFQWVFWAVAWGLTVWQGAWMLRRVGDKIIDDMLVVSLIAAPVLVITKLIINIAYQPISSDGQPFILSGIDVGGALMLIVVALVAARVNKY